MLLPFSTPPAAPLPPPFPPLPRYPRASVSLPPNRFDQWMCGSSRVLPPDQFEFAKYEYTENMPALRRALRLQVARKVRFDG